MPSHTDNPPTDTAPRKFLSTLRDVLFEPDAAAPASVATTPANAPSTDAANAALVALRQALDEHRGPAVREFALQLEALCEAIPSAALRRRAALRVLALKGTTQAALLLEISEILRALDEQQRSFANKLEQRGAALEARRSEAASTCQHDAEAAERAIAELEAALRDERTKLAAAAAHRNQLLAECDAAAAELAEKGRGFERAHAELRSEYAQLERELSQPETS